MAWFDFLFAESEKKAVLDWLVEHDTGDYHGFPMTYGYKHNRLYYENTYSLDALKQMKEAMIAKHERYLHEKAHPKPKVGETYEVFICGQHVDTLQHVTDVSSNEKGAFFTIANEDGSTTLKEYWGNGNINWTRA
jgi:hypothetical protein